MLSVDEIKNIPGWLGPEAAQAMYDCGLKAPLPRFLELGTYAGKSAVVLALALKNGHGTGTLMCCDLFHKKTWYKGNKGQDPVVLENMEKITWSNLEKFKVDDYVLTFRGDYGAALESMKTKFGLIYVDGGHEMERVLLDCVKAWEYLVPNGYLVFHDYGNDMYPGVKKAIDAMMHVWKDEFSIVDHVGMTLILQKM